MKSLKKKKRGFTLVEMLVAVSIFTVSLLGIMSVLASGIADTSYAKKKMTAIYLAQEGIEYIRNMRDNAILFGNEASNAKWNKFTTKFQSCGNTTGCGINNLVPVSSNQFIITCSASAKNCNLFLKDGGYSYSENRTSDVDSGFVRKVWIEDVPPNDEVKIFSEVTWGSGDYNITFSENLFNWW